VLNAREAYGLSGLVLAGFMRVVTHPRVFSPPSPTGHALEFAEALRGHPNCVHVAAGERHWDIFAGLCRDARAKGNLIPDAYLAALAIESGSEWTTTDRDYSRFPGLRWRDPGA
jgi:toxin-antitoxin system PIN domain toxin